MTKQEVEHQAHRLVDYLRPRMGLEDWCVILEFASLEGKQDANCAAAYDYQEARIAIDYERVTSTRHLCSTIRHEMAHVLHAGCSLFEEAVREEKGGELPPALDRLVIHGAESTVRCLERMMDRSPDLNLDALEGVIAG